MSENMSWSGVVSELSNKVESAIKKIFEQFTDHPIKSLVYIFILVTAMRWITKGGTTK